MSAYLLDDSDSQWAERERQRVSVSRISRPYWDAIPAADRERIVAAVPNDCRLVIVPGYKSKPGTATVSLRDERNYTVGESIRGSDIAHLCWSVLPRVTVTTDADGWIEDIA